MPIYEYICAPCDRRFEKLTTFSRASEATCPECGSDDVRRVMSTFAARSSNGGSIGGNDCAGCASGQCGSCNCSH